MRVLVACEFSGRVRDAFRKRGHDAWSCDFKECLSSNEWHLKGDVRNFLRDDWDLMIAHPPCTHLAVSGRNWFKYKPNAQKQALEFVELLLDAPIFRIALENPVSIISTKIRKPNQIIQPWMFGHGQKKTTCLWLKNLTRLQPTDIVEGRGEKISRMGRKNRGEKRSLTYVGIAKAMAEQWGKLPARKN